MMTVIAVMTPRYARKYSAARLGLTVGGHHRDERHHREIEDPREGFTSRGTGPWRVP